ncbi:hypothetical protein LCGC14_0406370 [marine sediment metagenome]|uniref:Elp3/MiaA/NifB-like radical SAM core domain-containing protein n=1 Tax=marine sediment metagenome TaxID=412755 RepID=A0A0F9W4H2_9ZZZZ
MNILLLNIDSKLPNIALHKIAMWHAQQGDSVLWGSPMDIYNADKVYASCIFTKNKQKVENLLGLHPNIMAGGSGFDLDIKLPQEIEGVKPHINYGYTSLGCIRNCPFCIVRRKEGYWHAIGDIYDVWDGKNEWVVLYDNNPYADEDHFEKIARQAIRESLAIDWNQGMDIRLLTVRIIKLLNEVRLKGGVRFAFDYPELEPIVREKIALLRQHYKRKYIFFYVLVGFNTTFEQDLQRCNLLRKLDCRPYIMRHENTPREKQYIRLAEWCNQFWTFAKYDFETFCVEYEKR